MKWHPDFDIDQVQDISVQEFSQVTLVKNAEPSLLTQKQLEPIEQQSEIKKKPLSLLERVKIHVNCRFAKKKNKGP